jgi:NADH dehydrogenase FAD-containing subunit
VGSAVSPRRRLSAKRRPVNILIDRTNHHLFQPLLYRVATAVLAPGQISSPIRGILRKQKNTTVIMGEVTGVDKEKRCAFVNSPDREHVPVPYDYNSGNWGSA